MNQFYVEFKGPQVFAQCFENGTAHFSWNLSPNKVLSPNKDLSLSFLEYSRRGWLISGNCTHENNTIYTSNAFVSLTNVHIVMMICTIYVRSYNVQIMKHLNFLI